MLPRVRSRGLCQTCRSDLQSLFERGFCTTTTPATKTFQSTSKLPIRPLVSNRRTFSHRPRLLVAESRNGASVRADDGPHELLNEEEMLASQVAAIEALEKELGKPVEEAMEDDLRLAERTMDDAEIGTHSDGATRLKDYMDRLRQSGASSADIVRETRQLLGDSLPEDVLQDEEVKLYKRLYGEPSKMPGEDEFIEEEFEDGHEETPQLLDAEGEPIDYSLQNKEGFGVIDEPEGVPLPTGDIGIKALTRDASAEEIARALGGRLVEEEEYEDEDEEEDDDEEYDGSVFRSHPLTRLGKFATSPRTVFPNEEGFVRPVEKVMSNFSNKQLKEMCQRTFGGEGLPDSPLTPRSGRARQQVPVPLEAGQSFMGEMEANTFLTAVMPPTHASIMAVLAETRKRLGPTWLNNLLAKEGGPRVLDASGGGAGIIAWREIVQAHWDTIHSSDRHPPPPPATKAVVLTGSDALRHRAASMLDNTTFIPRLPDIVHTRNAPTLEDDRPAQQRKQFDVVIAPHSLFALKEEWLRKQHVQNLWSLTSSNGGVLILLEKGVPRGFEALAGAREMLLERFIAVPEGHTTRYSSMAEDPLHKRETGMIVAPCTTHERCPMYKAQGLSRGRKDICSVQQRYIRPAFLQRVLGAKDRNHDDVDFSYLSVMKGDDLRLRRATTWEHVADPLSAPIDTSPTQLASDTTYLKPYIGTGFESWTPNSFPDENPGGDLPPRNIAPTTSLFPRSVFPPLKRRGHVTLDLCTPAGRIERWTIPRSFSKQAYRDARKSRWGDLWALGAKTRIPRNLRLGVSEKDITAQMRRGEPVGKGRGRKERMKIKAMEMLEQREAERLDEMQEQREFMQELDEAVAEDEADSVVLDENLQRRPAKPKRQTPASKPLSKSVPPSTASTQYHTNLHSSQSQTPSSNPSPLSPSPSPSKIDTPASRHPYLSKSQSHTSNTQASNLSKDQVDTILTDWSSDFAADRNQGSKGRQGAAFAKFGKATKEARRMQRDMNRERILRERAEMGLGPKEG